MSLKDTFLDKFSSKSEKELRAIISKPEHYEPEALEAARELFETRKREYYDKWDYDSRDLDSNLNIEKIIEGNGGQTSINQEFLVPTKSGSVTILMIVLLMISTREIILFYSGERWLEDSWMLSSFKFFYFMLWVFLPLAHLLRRAEEGVLNSFMGRVIFDLIIMVGYLIVYWFYGQITGDKYHLTGTPSGLILLFLLVSLGTFIFEGVMEIVLRILVKLIWRN